MFDFSFSELLVCFLVALIVLGPEKMHALVRSLGRWTGKARVYMRNLSAELERETQAAELTRELRDAHRILNEQAAGVRSHVENLDRNLRAGADGVSADLKSGAGPVEEKATETVAAAESSTRQDTAGRGQ